MASLLNAADAFPKSPELAAILTVFDVTGCTDGEKLLLVSLQGLVNRNRPSIYLIWRHEERLWLDSYKEKGFIRGYTEIKHPENLLNEHAAVVKGLVQVNPSATGALNAAQMLASVEDGLLFVPDMDWMVGLKDRWPILADFRDRFASSVEAYQWALEHLWDRMNHQLCAIKYASCIAERDYAIAQKLFTFWISGEVDGLMTGASQAEETEFAKKLFRLLPPNRPIMGYPYAGEGIGPGEGGGVSLATEFGKFIACDSPNLTIHSGVRIPELKQRRDIRMPCPDYDASKIYISFVLSDGDNMNCWDAAHLPLWQQNSRGQLPISWNVMPGLYDLIPGILTYYYESASGRDEFITAGSGIGYANPYRYSIQFQDELEVSRIFEEYVTSTGEYMRCMDLDILNPYHLGYIIDHQNVDSFQTMNHHMPAVKKMLSEYKRLLPGVKGIFPDYARTPGMNYEHSYYFLDDIPVFHALSSHFWPSEGREKDIEKKVEELRQVTGQARPAFVHVFMVNWCFGPDDIQTICDKLGEDYVPVLPSHLIQLAQRAKGK